MCLRSKLNSSKGTGTPFSGCGVEGGVGDKTDKNNSIITSSIPSGSAEKVLPGSRASNSTEGSTKCNGHESLISKHLIDPTIATLCGPKKPRLRARLLTSAESLKQLEEKERKTHEEKEEKER